MRPKAQFGSAGQSTDSKSRYAADEDVEDGFRTLLAKLPSNLEVWTSLAEQYRMNIFCGLFLDARNRGFKLSAELLKMLGDRHIEVGFDIYGPDEPSAASLDGE